MNQLVPLFLNVNGKEFTLPVHPGDTLAFVLRQRLGLTGTKIACQESECGSCTVLVEDEAILSCSYPALRAAGKRVVTIEGLTSTPDDMLPVLEELHPLQAAFITHGAVQCGFCIPGQIMTAYALLKENANPTSAQIRHALKDTLCRCAGYPTIETRYKPLHRRCAITALCLLPRLSPQASRWR